MKLCAICISGLEKVCKNEIESLIDTKATIKDSVILFETDNIEDIAKVIYMSRSISKILLCFE